MKNLYTLKGNLLHRIELYLICIFALMGTLEVAHAQTPQAIPYQGVARNASGDIRALQNISLRFSIHDVTPAGTIVFSETHNVTTTNLGLFNVNIGSGTAVTGTLAGVNWGTGAKFMQVEMDAAGGANFADMGTTQLNSVPYALYAANANVPGVPGPAGPQGIAGPLGPEGIQGVAGATGPAPSGTGIVTVSGGVLGTPGGLSGDVTTSGAGLVTTLSSTGVSTGTYSKVTVDGKGRVTFGTQATASDIGLGNVNNTSDLAKPVSTAQQLALDLKEDLTNKSDNTSLGTSSTLYPTQNAVKSYVDTSVSSVSAANATAISNEAAARVAADNALQGNIDSEATARIAGDTTNADAITAEATARGAADTTLQGNIDSEATARISGDAANATAISDEANTRSAADTAHDSAIAANATAISDEVNTRSAADTAHDSAIAANATAISDEANTRSAADTAHDSAIAANATAISNEVTARTNADTAHDTVIALKANLASPTFTGTVSGITKAMVGLGNVDNTSDANKPVSSATQTALNLKEDLVNKSTNVTTDGSSDIKYPSVKAVKTYVDTQIATANTSYQATPTNPNATNSTTGVMMGLGATITPTKSGKLLIIISGSISLTTWNAITGTVQIRYGAVGTIPSYGAAATAGTAAGSAIVHKSPTGGNGSPVTGTFPFTCNAIVPSLVVGTQYWVDLSSILSAAGNTVTLTNISISIVEL